MRISFYLFIIFKKDVHIETWPLLVPANLFRINDYSINNFHNRTSVFPAVPPIRNSSICVGVFIVYFPLWPWNACLVWLFIWAHAVWIKLLLIRCLKIKTNKSRTTRIGCTLDILLWELLTQTRTIQQLLHQCCTE